MALLSLPLLVNFVGRVQDEQHMADAARQSADEVLRSEIRNAQLHDALVYAQSDAFTERYAREQMHYTKAGEVLVLPPAGPDLTASLHPWWQDFITDDMTATEVLATDVTATVPVTHTPAVVDNNR